MGEYPRIPSSPMEFRKNERGISLGSRRFIPLHTLDALISERRYSLHSRELCTQLGARETTEHTHSERAKAILGYDDLQYCKAELRGDEGSLRDNRLIGWHLVYSVGTRVTLGSDRTQSFVESEGTCRRLSARVFSTFPSLASLRFWSTRIYNIAAGGSDAAGDPCGN